MITSLNAVSPQVMRLVIGMIRPGVSVNELAKAATAFANLRGFDVIDLGNDVSPQRFIDTAEKEGAHVIGMSALLTTTMPVMKKVVDLAKERQLFGKTRIIVGGAPLSSEYAKEIGADAYCFDGVNAVECMKKFLGGN